LGRAEKKRRVEKKREDDSWEGGKGWRGKKSPDKGGMKKLEPLTNLSKK